MLSSHIAQLLKSYGHFRTLGSRSPCQIFQVKQIHQSTASHVMMFYNERYGEKFTEPFTDTFGLLVSELCIVQSTSASVTIRIQPESQQQTFPKEMTSPRGGKGTTWLIHSLSTDDNRCTMLVYCWATVCDAGPALNQHWDILFDGISM